MIYDIGDTLRCTKEMNTRQLEMTNPEFIIQVGDIYTVTDKDDFPDDNECHCYELTSSKDEKLVLNAWDDEGHMIVSEGFKKINLCACCNKEINPDEDVYEHEYGRIFCSAECLLEEGFYGHWKKIRLKTK